MKDLKTEEIMKYPKLSVLKIFLMKNSFLLKILFLIFVCIFLIAKTKQIKRKISVKKNKTLNDNFEYLKNCSIKHYSTIHKFKGRNKNENYYAKAVAKLKHEQIMRAIIFHYQNDKSNDTDFQQLYHSWIEIKKQEPEAWRTDLVVFFNINTARKNQLFERLNCTITNIRKTKTDSSMCIIVDYKSIFERDINSLRSSESIYSILFNDIDIFDKNDDSIWKFHERLKDFYPNEFIDSILISFDGFEYLKQSYDFLFRSNMNNFLTPLFNEWHPLNCNDFLIGHSSDSHKVNVSRIKMAAKNIKFISGNLETFSLTWYSTPHQFRLVSYLTLVSMMYLSDIEKFYQNDTTSVEILLYGLHLTLNHLTGLKIINLITLS